MHAELVGKQLERRDHHRARQRGHRSCVEAQPAGKAARIGGLSPLAMDGDRRLLGSLRKD